MQSIIKNYGNLKALGLAVLVSAAALVGAYVSGGQATPAVVKLNPVSLGSDSSGAWVEDSTAWSLFDGDTAAAYTPAASPSRIMVNLPLATDIASIKVYGPASYDLTVYDGSSGSWVAVTGLQVIALRTQAAALNTFKPSSAIKTSKLMFEFSASSGNAGGIKEIEIWGNDPGDPGLSLKGIKTPADAKNVLISFPRPAHIIDLVGTPQTIDVPADSNSYTINFSLGTDPRLVKRAYLVYDSYNADYPVSPEKRINGLSWSGGFVPTSSEAPVWTSHVEEINPAWLLKGANAVEFRNQVAGREPASYTISDFKVLAELDNGWNNVSALEGTSGDLTHGPATAYDGDTNTYFELSSVNTLDIKTDRTVQPETIKLNLWSASGSPAGKLTIQYLQGGQWKSFASGGTLDLATLHDGWNDIAVPAKVAADALRLAFEVPSDRRRQNTTVGGVTEVRLIGSPTGIKPSRGIVLTYPLAGEFFGRTAFFQGFIDPANNGSGAVQVAIEGKAASKPDGVVALSLSKDETRFASQLDNDAWEAAVSASYPDGTNLARTVVLNKNVLNTAPTNSNDSGDTASTTRDKYSEKVAPGQAKKIQYKGVTLDIPEGAVDKEIEITIMPLTEADLNRLNPGMIDVTYPAAGYRFLPHGAKFKKPIKISFGYSKQLLAAGQKDDEVNMYFYDESLLRWQKLSRVKVDGTVSQVTSESDHFTDIINSTLVVPEHPQALSFNPNSIKDIKAADPSANIDLIEPPKANNTGSANLSYPIEIPKGRGAYTPDLRMTYSSGNANGWMGLGWDIPIPSIQVDTRWGVPTYNPEKETESYLLAGQSLAPVFKLFDDPQIDRQADLRFYKRVEGDFLKIIRVGTGPTNYSWVVTDKSGVKYYYGTTAQARLADYATGNVFQWFLEKVVDTNGNVTVYNYYTDTQQKYLNTLSDSFAPPQNALGGENWVYVYLDTINYTDNERTNTGAKYSVQFVRDNGSRKDLTVGGKSGFKTAERFRLNSVVVKFNNDIIRSYGFGYQTGDFSKSLLSKVTVTGANGAEFYSHSFDYYQTGKDNGIAKGFSGSATWSTSNSGVLTRVKEESHNRNFYNGESLLPQRSVSYGKLSGFTESDSQTTSKFVDVNGDGLPDMLFDNGAVHLNIGGPGGLPTFQSSGVSGLPAIEREQRRTDTWGKASYLGLGSHTEDMAITASKSCATMKDLNGDGLIDVAFGTMAFMNHVDTAGRNEFVQADNWAFSSRADLGSMESYRKEHFHLVDPVRKWVAPFAGDIAITGTIQKRKREDAKQITNPDGDGLTLYVYRENTEIGKLTIAADDYTSHQLGGLVNSGTDAITLSGIQQGERIYFRQNSFDNGENDEIIFDPVITYIASGGRSASSLQTLKDKSGRPLYVYSGSSDFSLADKTAIIWGAQHTGTFALTGRITKRTTTDDVRITIKRSTNAEYDVWDSTLRSYTLLANEEQTIDLSESVVTTEGERFLFLVESDSGAVDPARVSVTAEAVFTQVETCVLAEDWSDYSCALSPVTLPDAKDDYGYSLYRFAPPINYPVLYTVPKAASTTWVAPYDGVIDIAGSVSRSNTTSVFIARITGINRSLWKQAVPAGGPTGFPLSDYPELYSSGVTSISISKGDQLFFEIQSEEPLNNAVSWSPAVRYKEYCGPDPVTGQNGCWPETCTVDTEGTTVCSLKGLEYIFYPAVQYYFEDADDYQEPFGGGFRQWHYGEWNGNNEWDQSRITIPDPDDETGTAANDFTGMMPAPGGTLYSGGQPAWTSLEDRSFIIANGVSSSRLAEGSMAGSCYDGGVLRHSTGTNQNVSGSFSVGGTNRSHGNTDTQIELLDMNGDGYPDLVTPNRVVLSDGKTGLKSDGTAPGTFRTNYNDNVGYNLSIGATVNAISSKAKTFSTASAKSGSAGASIWQYISLSAGYVRGRSSTKSELIDVNGDGLPDLVYQGNPQLLMLEGVPSITVRLNLGSRFGAEEQWYLPGDSKIRDDATKTLSINLGLDLMGYIGTSRGLSIAVQKGERDMVDINGDGLPDMVSKKSEDDYITVRINQGGSFGEEESWYIPSWETSPPQRRGELQIWSTLFGFRGTSDYLDEIMFENDTLSNMTTETDTHGWFANGVFPMFNRKRPWKNFMFRIKGRDAARTNTHVKSQIDFMDIDGDGLPDHILKANTYYDIEVKRNLSGKANLLKSVKRPQGGMFEITYERVGNKVDYSDPKQLIDMQHSRWVLSHVTLRDGMKNSSGQHVYETSYAYGTGYYNRQEREFHGFNTVAETRGSGSDMVTVAQTYDNQDYYRKGLLLASETRQGNASGKIYASTLSDYGLRAEAVSDSRFPYLSKTTTNFYNVQAQTVAKTTSQEYVSYDQYGNILEYVDHADGVGNDVFASIRYGYDQSHYIVNKPTSIEVKDGAGRLYRSRSAFYENGTGNLKTLSMLVQSGKSATWNMDYDPDNGNLTRIIAPPGDPQYNAKTDGYVLNYAYDDEVQTYAVAITDSFGYASSAAYDLRFGQAIWSRDINGNYQKNTYDDFGRMTAIYGPNAVNSASGGIICPPTISFTYTAPAFDSSAASDSELANYLSSPASAVTLNRADTSKGCTSDTIGTATFADGMKRIIQTRKDAEIKGAPGVIVSGAVEFDSLGRVVKQGQPVPGKASLGAYEELSPWNPTVFAYDTLDRTTGITTPDGALTTTEYGFSVPPQGGGMMFMTTVNDPNTRVSNPRTGKGIKISYKDAHEKILAVQEDKSGNYITTQYTYNVLGEITAVTDAKNHTTTIEYDLLGRRLSIDNLDTGLTKYTYDANGNVTTKETAELRTGAKLIEYQYDYNRLTKINYPVSTDVVYEYGSPSEGGDQNGNLAGRIKQVTDESGTEQRWYGRLGETVKELKQINASNNPVARNRYETDYVFDSFGRMKEMTYPDGEVLSYVYDKGGLLNKAVGSKRQNPYKYINAINYDEFGQRTSIEYGNGVKTAYTYYPLTRRLFQLRTTEPTKNRVIQDITYYYDLVGNILDIVNGAPVPTGGEIGGTTEHHYTYDDLYQLTTANGYHLPAPGKRTTYTNNFVYDTIGNIMSKTQRHLIVGTNSSQEPSETNYSFDYKYAGAQPHAVTDAGDKLYAYDKNGNMTGWTSKTTNAVRVITWNEENRVKNIADSGNGTSFLYDDQGERVVKGGGGNESVYLNRFYSLKNGDLGSKHIFAGETRVCTKIEKDGGSLSSGIPGSIALVNSQGIYNALRQGSGQKKGIKRRLVSGTGTTTTGTNPPLEKFEFFYHGDHLGSSSFITDDAGAVYQHLEYFPYGETWVEDGGSGQMPMYRFTGKELDPETGLYYYGARYYDPVLSRWISADPALIDYLSIEKLKILTMGDSGIYGGNYNYNHGYFSPQVDKYIKNDHLYEQALYGSDKPGMYRPSNLHLYTYTFNNPVKNIDPNGLQTVSGALTFDLGPVKTGAGFELSPNDFTITQPTSVGAPATTVGISGQLGFNPASHEIGPKMGNVSTSVNAGIYAKDFSAGAVIESGKPLGFELGFGISLGPLKAGAYANATKTKTVFSLGQFMAQVEMEICNALGIPYGVPRY